MTDAAARIDALNAASSRPTHSRIVAFGARRRRARRHAGAARARRSRSGVDATASIVKRGGSRPRARAAPGARRASRPAIVPRIVLFSDGRETAGDVDDAVTQLAADGIPVFVEPMAPRDHRRHVGRSRSSCPSRLTAGGARDGHRRASAARSAGSALVELTSGDTVLASQTGHARRRDDGRAARRDVRRRRARRRSKPSVTVPGDPLARQQPARARGRWSRARPRVLYVEGAPRERQVPAGRARAVRVRRHGAAARRRCRDRSRDLEPWDVVILSDIARDGDFRRRR